MKQSAYVAGLWGLTEVDSKPFEVLRALTTNVVGKCINRHRSERLKNHKHDRGREGGAGHADGRLSPSQGFDALPRHAGLGGIRIREPIISILQRGGDKATSSDPINGYISVTLHAIVRSLGDSKATPGPGKLPAAGRGPTVRQGPAGSAGAARELLSGGLRAEAAVRPGLP
eukprot:748210-Hanusia_phi.AAC.2